MALRAVSFWDECDEKGEDEESQKETCATLMTAHGNDGKNAADGATNEDDEEGQDAAKIWANVRSTTAASRRHKDKEEVVEWDDDRDHEK